MAKHDYNEAARVQVALASIDVLSIKAKTGVFPKALSRNYIDPCNDKQLHYRQQGVGFVIYSVGPSGTFDGSTARKNGWDNYFVYPAPPKKPLSSDALTTFSF